MSNQNLVPRTDKSGSLGTSTKSWGTGSFYKLITRGAGSTLSGSFSGSYEGDGSNLSGIVATVVQPTFLDFNTGSSEPAYREGRLYYDNTDKTLTLMNDQSDVRLNIGEESYIRMVNKTGATILNGTAVRISGSQGNRPVAGLAISKIHPFSNGSGTETEIAGIATHDILNNQEGFITAFGIVSSLDTSNFSNGSILYVSSSAGELTDVRPSPPYDVLEVGVVANSHATQGKVFVKPKHSIHLRDISGISSSANPVDGDVLKYNSSNNWFEFGQVTSTSASYAATASWTDSGVPWSGVHLVKSNTATKYNSIGAALTAAVSNDVVMVGPGTYVETDLEVPRNVRLLGKTGASNDVLIYAISSTNEAILLNHQSTLSNMMILGPNDSNPILRFYSTDQSGSCVVNNCRVLGGGGGGPGIQHSVPGYMSVLQTSFADGIPGTISHGIYKSGSGTLFCRDIIGAGSADNLMEFQGSGVVDILRVLTLGDGYANYGVGLNLNSSGSLLLTDCYLDKGLTSAIKINSGSDGGFFQFYGGELTGVVNDFVIDSGATGTGTRLYINNVGARLERFNNSSLTWLSNAELAGIYADQGVTDDNTIGILGQLSVGIPGAGAESIFGEGDSTTLGMKILDSGSNGWTDLTNDLKTAANGNSTIFSDSGSGAVVYIGNVSPRKFSGFKVDTVDAYVGPKGVWEYWNGSSWNSFNIMSTDSDSPYSQYGNLAYVSASDSEHVRFGTDTFLDSWATGSVSGSNGYWVRHRLDQGISGSVDLQRIKLHTNRSEFNPDGHLEHFGTAEPFKDLIWHNELAVDLAGSSPSNSNIDISANITLVGTNNSFTGNARDGRGGMLEIPIGLDTSRQFRFDIYWYAQTNGSPSTVELEMDIAEVKIGNTLNGTISETNYAKVETIGTSDAGVLKKTSFDISAPTLVPGEFLAFSFFRDATAGNADDNYTGAITIVKTIWEGYFWEE